MSKEYNLTIKELNGVTLSPDRVITVIATDFDSLLRAVGANLNLTNTIIQFYDVDWGEWIVLTQRNMSDYKLDQQMNYVRITGTAHKTLNIKQLNGVDQDNNVITVIATDFDSLLRAVGDNLNLTNTIIQFYDVDWGEWLVLTQRNMSDFKLDKVTDVKIKGDPAPDQNPAADQNPAPDVQDIDNALRAVRATMNHVLPPDWFKALTRDGKVYYVNEDTRTTQWDIPIISVQDQPPQDQPPQSKKLLLFFDLDNTLISQRKNIFSKETVEKNPPLVHLGQLNLNEGILYPSSQKEADQRTDPAKGVYYPDKAGQPYEPHINNIITTQGLVDLLHEATDNKSVDWYIISRGGNNQYFEMLQAFAISQGKKITPDGQVWGDAAGLEFKKGEKIKTILDTKYRNGNYEAFFIDDRDDERVNVNDTLTTKGYNITSKEIKENTYGIEIKQSDYKKNGTEVTLFGEKYILEPGPPPRPGEQPDAPLVRTTDAEKAEIGQWAQGIIHWYTSTGATLVHEELKDELMSKVQSYGSASEGVIEPRLPVQPPQYQPPAPSQLPELVSGVDEGRALQEQTQLQERIDELGYSVAEKYMTKELFEIQGTDTTAIDAEINAITAELDELKKQRTIRKGPLSQPPSEQPPDPMSEEKKNLESLKGRIHNLEETNKFLQEIPDSKETVDENVAIISSIMEQIRKIENKPVQQAPAQQAQPPVAEPPIEDKSVRELEDMLQRGLEDPRVVTEQLIIKLTKQSDDKKSTIEFLKRISQPTTELVNELAGITEKIERLSIQQHSKAVFFDLDETLICNGRLLHEKLKPPYILIEGHDGNGIITSEYIIDLLHECSKKDNNTDWYIISRGNNIDKLQLLIGEGEKRGKNINPNGTFFELEAPLDKANAIDGIMKDKNYQSGIFVDDKIKNCEAVANVSNIIKCIHVKKDWFNIIQPGSDATEEHPDSQGIIYRPKNSDIYKVALYSTEGPFILSIKLISQSIKDEIMLYVKEHKKIKQLVDMGFADQGAILGALSAAKGDITIASEMLLEGAPERRGGYKKNSKRRTKNKRKSKNSKRKLKNSKRKSKNSKRRRTKSKKKV